MQVKKHDWSSPALQDRLKRRHRSEALFRRFGGFAVLSAGAMLLFLLATIFSSAIDGFRHSEVKLTIPLSAPELASAAVGTQADRAAALQTAGLRRILLSALRIEFPDVSGRSQSRRLLSILSVGAQTKLERRLLDKPELIGGTVTLWLPLSDDIDQSIKGKIDLTVAEADRRISDIEQSWIAQLTEKNLIRTSFNFGFFTQGDSSEPEMAGIFGAAVGSALTLFVTLVTSLPIGLLSAIYLEEFARKSFLTQIIEVNINNLAAVPSVIYGLLGLFLFLGVMNLPRSSPLVGGLTLALMTLPTIIIASRAAIRAVPDDIRLGAMALGASRMQVVFHHIIPVALPGIMTGTIIGMSRALGETAPLLMIGMVAFIVSAPESVTDPSTVLPVQIFLWSKGPERAFIEKTSAAILVLILFLILMNAVAIWLRQRFDKRV